MSGKEQTQAQSKREVAYFCAPETHDLVNSKNCYKLLQTARLSSKNLAATYRQCYPSPPRPVLLKGRLSTFFRSFLSKTRVDIGYQPPLSIGDGSSELGALSETKIGRKRCRKFQLYLPQWQCSVLPVALKAMSSAVLQVRAQVLSRQRCLAPTGLARSLQVRPLACFVTMQESTPAARLTQAPVLGRAKKMNRCMGQSRAAVFAF